MSDKTEEPTDHKLEQARKKGQIPKSQDVTSAVGLIGLLLLLMGSADSIYEAFSRIFEQAIGRGVAVQTNDEMLVLVADLLTEGVMASVPVLCASVLLAVVGLFGQIGFNLSFEAVAPKFDSLNPAQGLKKIFSLKAMVELAKTVVKAVALGCVIWVMVLEMVPLIVGSAYLSTAGLGAVAWKAVLSLLGGACVVSVVIGPADYGLQRWMFMRDQKMSKDEVKRERKDSDGDPLIKGQLRSLREELATSDPKPRVTGATVVVTNPTHYAVALRYVAGVTALPVVVAKGMDAQAAEIRELALLHGVPIVGNPPLARALHKLRIDQPIPRELFEAVATVLLWVADLDTLADAG